MRLARLLLGANRSIRRTRDANANSNSSYYSACALLIKQQVCLAAPELDRLAPATQLTFGGAGAPVGIWPELAKSSGRQGEGQAGAKLAFPHELLRS